MFFVFLLIDRSNEWWKGTSFDIQTDVIHLWAIVGVTIKMWKCKWNQSYTQLHQSDKKQCIATFLSWCYTQFSSCIYTEFFCIWPVESGWSSELFFSVSYTMDNCVADIGLLCFGSTPNGASPSFDAHML